MSSETDCDGASGLTATFMENRQQLATFIRPFYRQHTDGYEVDDVLHELWLRCRTIDVSEVQDPRSYLFRIAHNLVIDRLRRAAVGRTVDRDWAYLNNRAGPGAEAPVAERRLVARERLVAVDAALRKVGERAAWIYRRYRIDGQLQGSIAAELGVSLSTVEKDLRKAYDAVIAFRETSDDD